MLGLVKSGTPARGKGKIGRPRVKPATVGAAVASLLATYGQPRHGNPLRPLDDLFYIILSNKTTPGSAQRVYRELRRAFPSWNQIGAGDLARLKELLEPAGLSNVRASQIVGIVERLRESFGLVTLTPLKGMTPDEAEAFLCDLPGVSLKVAKCVMMYTLGFQVLPVDNHVHRISVRLGWTAKNRADQCHEELEAVVPPSLRYGFHVAALAHGRSVCRPTNPDCNSCVVRRFCAYYSSQRKA